MRRVGQPVELVVVLDHPQRPQEWPAFSPAGSRHGPLQSNREETPQHVTDSNGALSCRTGDLSHFCGRIIRLLPGDDLQEVTLRGEERRLQGGGYVVRHALAREDEQAQPLRLMPIVADEIEEIGRWADQEEINALPGHLSLRAL